MKNVINISIKLLLMFIVCVTLFCTFDNNFVYAAGDFVGPVQPGYFDTNFWDPTGSVKEGDKELLEMGNKIIGPIQVIGSLVSVIAIIIIGIKYMLGSVEEKAQYKETLGPYFLGAVLVFGITNVLAIVYNIAISLNNL